MPNIPPRPDFLNNKEKTPAKTENKPETSEKKQGNYSVLDPNLCDPNVLHELYDLWQLAKDHEEGRTKITPANMGHRKKS